MGSLSMKRTVLLRGAIVAAATMIGCPTVFAQDMSGDLVRCGEIAEDGARLKCFDALVPHARKTDAQRRADAAAKSTAEFGLTPVQRNEQAKRDNPEKAARQELARQPDLSLTAKIAAMDMTPYSAVFTLDNGQVWQTTSYGSLRTIPRVGQGVQVKSGPLGGYRLTIEGKTSEVGVKRIK